MPLPLRLLLLLPDDRSALTRKHMSMGAHTRMLPRAHCLTMPCRDGNATPYESTESYGSQDEDLAYGGSASSMSRDGGAGEGVGVGGYERCVAECVLVAAHVELCGSACSLDLVSGAQWGGVGCRGGGGI
jgi:hypothetical protein